MKEVKLIKTVYELTEVLIDCFKEEVGTDSETMLHDDKYVTSKLKRHLGIKVYKEYDALSKEEWKEAWMEFVIKTWKKKNTQVGGFNEHYPDNE